MRSLRVLPAVAAAAALVLAGCSGSGSDSAGSGDSAASGSGQSGATVTLTVGASPSPHAKILQYIEDNLRDVPIRRLYKATRTKGGVGNITWDGTGSWVHAVPQGPDVFRSYTPSILIMDECDTQPQAEAALTAALPLAEKQAKIVLITTSQGPSKPAARIAKSAGFTRWT